MPPAPSEHASSDQPAQQVIQPLPALTTSGDEQAQPTEHGDPTARTLKSNDTIQLPGGGREDVPGQQGEQEAQQGLADAALAEPLKDAIGGLPREKDTAVLPSQGKDGNVPDGQNAEDGQAGLPEFQPSDPQLLGHSMLTTALQQLATSAKAAEEASMEVAEEDKRPVQID